MFYDGASAESVDELTDNDLAIRDAIEARRLANAIPDHSLPYCRTTSPTDRDGSSSGPRCLLTAVYNSQMWLLRTSLQTVRTITNVIWRRDDETKYQVCHQSMHVVSYRP